MPAAGPAPFTVQLDARKFVAAVRRIDAELPNELKREYLQIATAVANRARPAIPKKTGTLAASLRPGATKKGAAVRIGKAKVPYAGPALFGGYPASRPYDPEGRGFFPALQSQMGAVSAQTVAALTRIARKAGL